METFERAMKWSILGGWFLFNLYLIILMRLLFKVRRLYYNGAFETEMVSQTLRHSLPV